jgi:hypothetical protein
MYFNVFGAKSKVCINAPKPNQAKWPGSQIKLATEILKNNSKIRSLGQIKKPENSVI